MGGGGPQVFLSVCSVEVPKYGVRGQCCDDYEIPKENKKENRPWHNPQIFVSDKKIMRIQLWPTVVTNRKNLEIFSKYTHNNALWINMGWKNGTKSSWVTFRAILNQSL